MKYAAIPAAALAALLGGRPAIAGPSDIVPRGDIAYDQLGAFAAAGKLPGSTIRDFARGDRLYTRAEIAAYVHSLEANLAETPMPLNSPFLAALRALRIRFAPELHLLGDEKAESGVPASGAAVTGQVKYRLLSGPAAGAITARTSLTVPVGRDGFAAVSLGSWRDEWYATHVSGSKGHLYPTIETAFVRVNGRVLDVSVGTSPLRWGSGYAGSLILNDDMPSVPRLQIEKGFRLPGTVGARVGRIYFTEFIGEFFENEIPDAPPDATGTRRFLGGRRFELGGGPWTFSASETFKSTRLPDAQWAAILPTFYEYQNDWSRSSRTHPLRFLASSTLPDTFWFNYVADAGTTYRTGGRYNATFYADVLLDDIKAPPGIGLGDNTPSKFGYQIGVNVPRLDPNGKYGLRLEYAKLDPRTYTDISLPIEWTNNGVPIGFPAGSRVRSLFGRLDAAVSDRLHLAAEAEDRKDSGGGSLQLPAVEPLRRRISLFGTYTLRRDWFLGARFENRRYTSASSESTRNRAEVNIGYGF